MWMIFRCAETRLLGRVEVASAGEHDARLGHRPGARDGREHRLPRAPGQDREPHAVHVAGDRRRRLVEVGVRVEPDNTGDRLVQPRHHPDGREAATRQHDRKRARLSRAPDLERHEPHQLERGVTVAGPAGAEPVVELDHPRSDVRTGRAERSLRPVREQVLGTPADPVSQPAELVRDDNVPRSPARRRWYCARAPVPARTPPASQCGREDLNLHELSLTGS